MAKVEMPTPTKVEEKKIVLPERNRDAPKKEEIHIEGAVERKKTLGRKFKDTFLAEDISDIKDHLYEDIIKPSAQNLAFDIAESITDSIRDGFEMAIFGRSSSRSRKKRRKGSDSNTIFVDYGDYYSSENSRERERREQSRNSNNVKEYLFPTKDSAQSALELMSDYIQEHRVLSVGKYYEFLRKPTKAPDYNYGWSDISSAKIEKVDDGFMINLPKTKDIRGYD